MLYVCFALISEWIEVPWVGVCSTSMHMSSTKCLFWCHEACLTSESSRLYDHQHGQLNTWFMGDGLVLWSFRVTLLMTYKTPQTISLQKN